MSVLGKRVEQHDDLIIRGMFMYADSHNGMFFCCPCGCGEVCYLTFRSKDDGHPSWEWDGNIEQPTLHPSIQRMSGCHWHGFLKNGEWINA